jgi:hypothetical protein
MIAKLISLIIPCILFSSTENWICVPCTQMSENLNLANKREKAQGFCDSHKQTKKKKY